MNIRTRLSLLFSPFLVLSLTAGQEAAQAQTVIPPGFAHGFHVLSNSADYLYKTTEYYSHIHERSIAWNDNRLAINWQLGDELLVSEKDRTAPAFLLAEYL